MQMKIVLKNNLNSMIYEEILSWIFHITKKIEYPGRF